MLLLRTKSHEPGIFSNLDIMGHQLQTLGNFEFRNLALRGSADKLCVNVIQIRVEISSSGEETPPPPGGLPVGVLRARFLTLAVIHL
jgi:hypothetical protein